MVKENLELTEKQGEREREREGKKEEERGGRSQIERTWAWTLRS